MAQSLRPGSFAVPAALDRRAAALASLLSAWLWAAAPASAVAPAAQCPPHPMAQPAVLRLRDAMAQGRFIAYQPSSLQVIDGRFIEADAASIRADLTQLRERFDGLITYDAIHGAQQIPAIAATLRFRALIIGVWDPNDERQLAAALEAAQRFPRLVVGISLGNEMLFAHRSDPGALLQVLSRVRERAPAVPLSTTEPFHIYDPPEAAALLSRLDFLLLNVHPVFQPWFREASDTTAAQFVLNVLARLVPLACGPVLVKETGVPTAPASAGFTEAHQAGFYRELRRLLSPSRAQAFAYFAAYDAPWRASDATGVPGAPAVHPEEAHWGLYDEARRPKAAARELPRLPP